MGVMRFRESGKTAYRLGAFVVGAGIVVLIAFHDFEGKLSAAGFAH